MSQDDGAQLDSSYSGRKKICSETIIHKLEFGHDGNKVSTVTFQRDDNNKVIRMIQNMDEEKQPLKVQKLKMKPIQLGNMNSIRQGPDNRLYNYLDFDSYTYLDQYKGAAIKQSPKKIKCSCKQSRCLKMYCECFSNQLQCSKLCQCVSCQNNNEYEEIREQFLNRQKNKPLDFKKTLEISCNCNKSKCQKKYCVCYQNRQKCDPKLCKCENCENQEKIEYESEPQIVPTFYDEQANSQSRFLSNNPFARQYKNHRESVVHTQHSSFGFFRPKLGPTDDHFKLDSQGFL
ncbi:DNA binding [Paramecium bursaria]